MYGSTDWKGKRGREEAPGDRGATALRERKDPVGEPTQPIDRPMTRIEATANTEASTNPNRSEPSPGNYKRERGGHTRTAGAQ